MMNNNIALLTAQMIEYERDCPRRINHFLKVYAFSKSIGELEGLDEKNQYILESAALLHDCGIKPSMEKYNSSAGSYQQMEGPPVARQILQGLSDSKDVIERVCYLIAHHHTYTKIDGIDYQILVEADFLVNIDEDQMSGESIRTVREKYFKTKAGRQFLDALYHGKIK